LDFINHYVRFVTSSFVSYSVLYLAIWVILVIKYIETFNN